MYEHICRNSRASNRTFAPPPPHHPSVSCQPSPHTSSPYCDGDSLFLAQLLVLVDCDELADNVVLALEHVMPALQRLHLLRAEVLQLVQRTVEVLRQHVPVEAVAGQTTGSIAAGKVGVRASGAVEVPAAGDVKDLASDGHENRHVVLAVEGKQGPWVIGLEDRRRGVAGEGRRLAGLEEEV